ncbi:MAG: hypothetical protein JWO95_3363 [Verrucomicrobiales bacterium]|nr:hypothetical protein [Verrucomicrobiales bacterium]
MDIGLLAPSSRFRETSFEYSVPPLKRWAIFGHPCGICGRAETDGAEWI